MSPFSIGSYIFYQRVEATGKHLLSRLEAVQKFRNIYISRLGIQRHRLSSRAISVSGSLESRSN